MTTHTFTFATVWDAFTKHAFTLAVYILPLWCIQIFLMSIGKVFLLDQIIINKWAILGLVAVGIVIVDLSITIYKIAFAVLQNEPVKIIEYLMPRRGHSLSYRFMLLLLGILNICDVRTVSMCIALFLGYTISTSLFALIYIVSVLLSGMNILLTLLMADNNRANFLKKVFSLMQKHFKELGKGLAICFFAWVAYGTIMALALSLLSRIAPDTLLFVQQYKYLMVVLVIPVSLFSMVTVAKMYLHIEYKADE